MGHQGKPVQDVIRIYRQSERKKRREKREERKEQRAQTLPDFFTICCCVIVVVVVVVVVVIVVRGPIFFLFQFNYLSVEPLSLMMRANVRKEEKKTNKHSHFSNQVCFIIIHYFSACQSNNNFQ